MYPRGAVTCARLLVAAASVVCALLSGNAAARDVTVAIHVSTQGLDLNKLTDARMFYTRLANAAWIACTRGDRVDLLPVDDLMSCYETALGGAVRSARIPMVTQIYLATHTGQEAAKHGIEAPAQVAAK